MAASTTGSPTLTRPYSYRRPTEFSVPPPVNSDPVHNLAGYRAQTDKVLATSRDLTDYRKLVAEHFDDKIRSLGSTVFHIAEARRYSLDQFVFYDFLTQMAAFDAGIATWFFKLRYDAVRPFSAIRFLYGDRQLSAWGGPGRGTVTDIIGAEWHSYVNTADHPECPSATASFCSAHAQASRRFTATDNLGQTVLIGRGASGIEPGVTPAADTVLGPWRTWTQWETECGQSRLWAGVHFRDAITAGHALGRRVDDRAYRFLMAHIDGER